MTRASQTTRVRSSAPPIVARGRTGTAKNRALAGALKLKRKEGRQSDDSRGLRANNYSVKGEECEMLANRARDPHLKYLYRQLAIQWGELAEEAERKGW
jgi:hypothetical protein